MSKNNKPKLVPSDALKSEYDRLYPGAKNFSDFVASQILQLIHTHQISLSMPIENRVKEWSSLSVKLENQSLSIEKLTELNDLIGLRIILQFQRDIEPVCEMLGDSFEILEKYDTQERVKENQFGYASVHLIVKLKNEQLSIPPYNRMSDFRAEIQVRTTAQHIWASASHTLQYKSETAVPKSVQRALSRVSALLEIVDLELERVLLDKETYKKTLSNPVADEQLNVDLLEKILDENFNEENKLIGREHYADLLDDCLHFNINTRTQLASLIHKHLEEVIKEDKDRAKIYPRLSTYAGEEDFVDTRKTDVFFTHVGLAREALENEFGQKYTDYTINKVIESL